MGLGDKPNWPRSSSSANTGAAWATSSCCAARTRPQSRLCRHGQPHRRPVQPLQPGQQARAATAQLGHDQRQPGGSLKAGSPARPWGTATPPPLIAPDCPPLTIPRTSATKAGLNLSPPWPLQTHAVLHPTLSPFFTHGFNMNHTHRLRRLGGSLCTLALGLACTPAHRAAHSGHPQNPVERLPQLPAIEEIKNPHALTV